MSHSLLTALFAFTFWQTPLSPEGAPYYQSRTVCPENGPYAFSHGSTLVELPDGSLLCAWYAGSREMGEDVAVVGSRCPSGETTWSAPQVLVDTPNQSEGTSVLFLDEKTGLLWLFFETIEGSGEVPERPGSGWATCKVKAITSDDYGITWSPPRVLIDEWGYVTRNQAMALKDGTILLPITDARNWSSRILFSADGGQNWDLSEPIDCGLGYTKGNIEPALLERKDGTLLCLMRTGSERYRTWESISTDGGRSWTKPVEIEVPNANAALDLIRLDSGNVLMALNPIPEGGREKLSLWLSTDDAKTWSFFRDVESGPGYSSYPALIQARDGNIHMTYSRPNGGIREAILSESWVWQKGLVEGEFKLANVVPPLEPLGKPKDFPIPDQAFIEHVKGNVEGAPEGAIGGIAMNQQGDLFVATEQQIFQRTPAGEWSPVEGTELPATAPRVRVRMLAGTCPPLPLTPQNVTTDPFLINAVVECSGTTWMGTNQGLWFQGKGETLATRFDRYGVDGPLATTITALVADSSGTLWVGTPLGLSVRQPDGTWKAIRGGEGLPYEDITALAIDERNRLWIGTSMGAIHYRPYESGRQWFYRQGPRYLPGDRVTDIALSPGGMPAYFATPEGLGRIDAIETTLAKKADIIENRLNERHRRLGLVASCALDDAEKPTSHHIDDNDNDGLWTAYHVLAQSLAYAVTGSETSLRSASESMHALYMLQNASGIDGLVARSVLAAEEGKKKGRQWQPTPDGQWYWKSDTSSDEIDGHYLAFFAYYEHIARYIPEERKLIEEQVRKVTDYILDHNYQLIDWDGGRTRWGFWNPEALNDNPDDYVECGLNSLQILSFLKVAHHITGDPKYKAHFDKLVTEHHYLSNVLLSKKVFPDENNHSDNQLGFVAWYPILQLESDPKVQRALFSGVRRHYFTLMNDRSSFFNFAYGSIDPDFADIQGAVENLQEIPTDRRVWRMLNSHRADVAFNPQLTRFRKLQLMEVLPADERSVEKWNEDPYVPDGGGDGRKEDDGASWLMAYWLGRYHGFVGGPGSTP